MTRITISNQEYYSRDFDIKKFKNHFRKTEKTKHEGVKEKLEARHD